MTRDQLKEKLINYLPQNGIEQCIDFITLHRISLRITHSRRSKLGDYRAPHNGSAHRISINHNLNKYSFLITFIHEVAHLTAFNRYKHTIEPHGPEWKGEYKALLRPFLNSNVFPEDLHQALDNYLRNPAASSCTDENLYRTLKKYDEQNSHQLLEDLPEGTEFKLKGYTNVFIKGHLLRKTYHCKMKNSKREYRISGLAEVEQLTLF